MVGKLDGRNGLWLILWYCTTRIWAAHWLALLYGILDVAYSCLAPQVGYIGVRIFIVLLFPPGQCKDRALKWATTASIRTSSSSCSINHAPLESV
jgi:hypothetical protein